MKNVFTHRTDVHQRTSILQIAQRKVESCVENARKCSSFLTQLFKVRGGAVLDLLEALNKGKISQSRHNSYVMMYDEVKDIKDWMNKS